LVTIILILLVDFYPLSNFPQGGNVFTPSPVGEGWEGGLIIIKQYSNLDYLFSINCYLYCEELHGRKFGVTKV
jgi:hypothetical protein